jgi:O-antigen/teichoic acid export membrane protein
MSLIRKLKSPVFKNILISSADQAILSLSNFLVTILLIKFVSKGDFGYFNVTLTIISYFVSIQNALVTTPLIILLASKNKEQKQIFSSALFNGQLRAVIFIAILSIIVFLPLYLFDLEATVYLIGLAAGVSLIGILSREFFRTLSYAQEQAVRALKQDVLYILIYLLIIILSKFLYHVNVPFTVLAMGLSTILVYTFFNYKESVKVSREDIKNSYKETWILGKWSLIGVTVTHFQTYSYQYLIVILLGTLAVADNSASRLLLMPLVLLRQGWGNIVRPRGAKLRQQNKLKKFYKELILASTIITILILIYVIILELAGGIIEQYLFSEKYNKSIDYVYYWGGIFIFQYIRSNASFGLQVIKKFKNIALINSITMVITVLISFFLIGKFGVPGALIASMFGEFIFGSILWYFLTSYIFDKDPARIINFIKKS